MDEISYRLAFCAGFLTFISPCVFPLVPLYLSPMAGLPSGSSSRDTAVAGIGRLTTYAAGLAAAFFILALASVAPLIYFEKRQSLMKVLAIMSGVVMISFGGILLADNLRTLTALFPDFSINP